MGSEIESIEGRDREMKKTKKICGCLMAFVFAASCFAFSRADAFEGMNYGAPAAESDRGRMDEAEEYVNQKDDDEAAKAKEKRREDKPRASFPIFNKKT